MSAQAVLVLLAGLAREFGLVVTDVLDWARQQHPALRDEPLPPLDEVDDARADAVQRTGG